MATSGAEIMAKSNDGVSDGKIEDGKSESAGQEKKKAPVEDNDAPATKKLKVEEVEQALASRQGFSSEMFKVELRGLPKFCSVGEIKKLLFKQGLAYHKIKPCGKHATYVFVNFRSAEDRDRALKELEGAKIRGKGFQVLKAKPPKDPMLKAMEEGKRDGGKEEEPDTRPVMERLADAVCPLARLPYEEQLEQKAKDVEELMDKVRKQVHQEFSKCRVPSSVFSSHPLLDVRPFVGSPCTDGYRGKCEFSVGRHPETGETTVGFRLASYRKGVLSVAPVGEGIPVVSAEMRRVASTFEAMVRGTRLPPFDSLAQTGNWRQVTVRQASGGALMAWAVCHPQGLDEEKKEELRKTYLKAMEEAGVTSVHLQFLGARIKGEPEPPIEHLGGTPTITQKLNGLDFRISPQAFFQINCAAAEVLYRLAGEMASLDNDTTVFDVCCGTGTIGLCLAGQCREVFGVEIVAEAVKDANRNAEENGVKNAKFEAGRAEFLLSDQLKRASGSKVVAVVDPPRAGLHPKALQAIRSSKVTTLVYISCDARAAAHNFSTLARPTSNSHPGDPFVPRAVVPVDMFPHTRHFELAILFERVSMVGLIEGRYRAVDAKGKEVGGGDNEKGKKAAQEGDDEDKEEARDTTA